MINAGKVAPSSKPYEVICEHDHKTLKQGDIVVMVETPRKDNVLLRMSDVTLHWLSDDSDQYVHLSEVNEVNDQYVHLREAGTGNKPRPQIAKGKEMTDAQQKLQDFEDSIVEKYGPGVTLTEADSQKKICLEFLAGKLVYKDEVVRRLNGLLHSETQSKNHFVEKRTYQLANKLDGAIDILHDLIRVYEKP